MGRGVFLLLAAAAYAAYAQLNSWLMQPNYLVAGDVAPLPVPLFTGSQHSSPSPTVTPAARC